MTCTITIFKKLLIVCMRLSNQNMREKIKHFTLSQFLKNNYLLDNSKLYAIFMCSDTKLICGMQMFFESLNKI